jgi:hypothetical protein
MTYLPGQGTGAGLRPHYSVSMVCLRCGGEDFVGNEGSCISQETSFDDKTQEGSIPEGEWKDLTRIWSLMTSPRLSHKRSEPRPFSSHRDLRSWSFHGRPGPNRQGPSIYVTREKFGWPSKRLTPTDGLQRLSSLRKTGHVLVLVWFV